MQFIRNFEDARKKTEEVNHLIYSSYPMIQDKKLLLKILLETRAALVKCIASILQYEYFFRRIKLSKEPGENFKSFINKCAPRFGISVYDTRKIEELFEIAEEHKVSPFEFKKKEKIVILSQNSPPRVVTIENAKEYLKITRQILEKMKHQMIRKF